MICPKCKKENTKDAAFCRFCGNPIAEDGTGVPEVLPTTQGKRFVNYILDLILFYPYGFLFGLVVGGFIDIEVINDTLLGLILVLSYYILFELIWAKTPAKFITRTKVVMRNGKKPEFKDIVVRTLIRFIPFEAFSFLGSKNPLGWHDKWSKTMVIDDK